MRKEPASGEINQHITIVSPADTDDGAGGTIPGEITYWETYAKAEVLRSQRSAQANQETLKPSVSFILRNRIDKFVDSSMVILWRGERFTIMSAEPDYVYKRYLVIIGKAVQLPDQ